MEKSNFLQKIPLESGLTTHFGYMGVHIEKPHGHFFCTSYYPKYRHLDQCDPYGVLMKNGNPHSKKAKAARLVRLEKTCFSPFLLKA